MFISLPLQLIRVLWRTHFAVRAVMVHPIRRTNNPNIVYSMSDATNKNYGSLAETK
jgi:hypothetical protein